jgi:hypothetical protein
MGLAVFFIKKKQGEGEGSDMDLPQRCALSKKCFNICFDFDFI